GATNLTYSSADGTDFVPVIPSEAACRAGALREGLEESLVVIDVQIMLRRRDNKSDAKTHRTPSHFAQNRRQRVLFSRELLKSGRAFASPYQLPSDLMLATSAWRLPSPGLPA